MGPFSRCQGSKRPPSRFKGDMAYCPACGRWPCDTYPNGNVVCHLPELTDDCQRADRGWWDWRTDQWRPSGQLG